MRLALALARRGLGTTAPNPSVGAVVMSPEYPFVILGQGWTAPGGRPHGEPQALDMAAGRTQGATLYVTLEPCSHHGHTPPCAQRIIGAGIGRVVCSTPDPDSRVAGRGFDMLRQAGIGVVENVLADEGRFVNLGHILRMTQKRPFVQLKLALSANEKIASGNGKPVWVTGQQARNRGHLMRAQADAILVGRGTVQADNPSLTCRLPGLAGRSPIRVVLDSQLLMAQGSTLVRTARDIPVRVFCNNIDHNEHLLSDYFRLTDAGVMVHKYGKSREGAVDLADMLQTLARDGITRLMVEGGPAVLKSFLDAGLADEMVVFRSDKRLDRNAIAPFGDSSLAEMLEQAGLVLYDRRQLGSDVMMVYRRQEAEDRKPYTPVADKTQGSLKKTPACINREISSLSTVNRHAKLTHFGG